MLLFGGRALLFGSIVYSIPRGPNEPFEKEFLLLVTQFHGFGRFESLSNPRLLLKTVDVHKFQSDVSAIDSLKIITLC